MPFEVRPADVEEVMDGDPHEVAAHNARLKAETVARLLPGRLVLGADTIVTIDGDILGKPADAEEARRMLGRLQGRRHQVLGAIALATNGRNTRETLAVTDVEFRPLSSRAIDAYVGAGEWEGRAGAYAVQGKGAALVVALRPDYLNVVGLSVTALIDLEPDLVGELAR